MKANNYPGTRYTTNIEDFKAGRKTVLVCTNALARGLDVQAASVVRVNVCCCMSRVCGCVPPPPRPTPINPTKPTPLVYIRLTTPTPPPYHTPTKPGDQLRPLRPAALHAAHRARGPLRPRGDGHLAHPPLPGTCINALCAMSMGGWWHAYVHRALCLMSIDGWYGCGSVMACVRGTPPKQHRLRHGRVLNAPRLHIHTTTATPPPHTH